MVIISLSARASADRTQATWILVPQSKKDDSYLHVNRHSWLARIASTISNYGLPMHYSLHPNAHRMKNLVQAPRPAHERRVAGAKWAWPKTTTP